MKADYYDEDDEQHEEPPSCHRCGGEGRITTADYESYFGAMYKPCPVCFGDPCAEQPILS